MKKFRTLLELKDAPQEVFLEIKTIMMAAIRTVKESKMRAGPLAIDSALQPFDSMLGGDVFLVEGLEDLKEITHYDDDWWSVLEKPGMFDAAYYTPSQEFIFMFFTTNDSGGNSYYIPKDIADCVPNIKKCIELSNEGKLTTRTFRGPLSEIKRVSPVSGKCHTKLIPVSVEQIRNWQSEKVVTDSLAHLTADEVEFITSGITSEEYEISVTPALTL
jgi:hypothetical protein